MTELPATSCLVATKPGPRPSLNRCPPTRHAPNSRGEPPLSTTVEYRKVELHGKTTSLRVQIVRCSISFGKRNPSDRILLGEKNNLPELQTEVSTILKIQDMCLQDRKSTIHLVDPQEPSFSGKNANTEAMSVVELTPLHGLATEDCPVLKVAVSQMFLGARLHYRIHWIPRWNGT